jgi:hypothetical protein
MIEPHKNETQEQPKKPYTPPQLTVYGNVEQITQGLPGGTGDPVIGIGGTSIISDRNLKEHVAAVDGRDILARIAAVPVQTWNYKNQDSSIRHIGPMAQDFAVAFGVGESDKQISVVDAHGVAFAAIQALYEMIQEKDSQIDALRAELDTLKQ